MMNAVIIVVVMLVAQSLADCHSNFSTTVHMEKILTEKVHKYVFLDGYNLKGPVQSISFSVEACNDAHITLQPHQEGTLTTNPAYEIVIGGWANTKSVIRRKFQGDELAMYHQKELLHCHEERSFWVSWAHGEVKVGFGTVPSDFTKFLHYVDASPLPVAGLAVATGWGSHGIWLINKPHEVMSIHTKNEYYYQQVPNVNADAADYIVFQVKAQNDAHVTLQPISGSVTSDAYEIVIGGWKNTKSVIRRKFQGTNLVEHSQAILNASEFRTFWLSWKNGEISLGHGRDNTEATRIMHYRDEHPRPVTRVGISTGFGATGEWKIDNPNI